MTAILVALACALGYVVPDGVSAQASGHAGGAAGSVRLMAVGDAFLGLSVGRRIVGNGPHVPFAAVAGLFDDADLVLANLECTLSNDGEPWPRKLLHFAAPAQAANALALGGIDIVSVANNHTLDYGRAAFLETLDLLDANAIRHVGGGVDATTARAPLVIEVNGLRIGLLSYVVGFSGPVRFNTKAWEAGSDTPGIAIARPTEIAADVKSARAAVDVVLVAIHSGGEFRARPNRGQRRMAAVAIEAGASLVVGHGPHVLQGYRSSGKTLIAYSLGNFVFPGYTGLSNDSVILDVTLSAAGVESFGWIPIVVHKGLPRPAQGAEIDRILAQLRPV